MSVDCRHEKVSMETYRIIDEDPLPRFFEYYPYTGLNDFDERPVSITYDSIVVENEYLRMRIIPSLGARLYDLYDKVNGAHVFHYNERIRPAMIAMRGAWISTGMEFNSLDRPHHTVDNFSPVDCKVERGDDGSVTVNMGNLNLLTNIYWLVGLTLRPGRQFLETRVKIFNDDLLYNRYYFWTNTAEPVTDGSRIFIPGKRTQAGTFPIFKGMDVSWYKNCKYAVDAFIIDCEEDFFGYYDYNTERGVVQHANHFIVPGKKRFTWGASEDGLFWASILSDKAIPYMELQSGRFRTQSIVQFIDPHFFEEWNEWWYPIAKIGGISFANKDIAIYVEREGRIGKAFLGVYATKDLPGCRILIRNGGRIVEEAFDLSPQNPFLKNYALRDEKIEVDVLDRDGQQIIAWDCRDYRTKLDESVLQAPAEYVGGEDDGFGKGGGTVDPWADALLEDERGERLIAELKYKRLLELDEGSPRGLCSLAVLYCRQGRYDEALELLERAVRGHPDDADALYYLGLCYLKVGRCSDSQIALWKARRFQKYFSLASYCIALIKIRSKEYEEAEEIISEGLHRNTNDLKGLFLYASVLRRRGRLKEALEVVGQALRLWPLYYPMICERMMCSKSLEGFEKAESEFKGIVLANGEKLLDVAGEYVMAGLYEEAEEILRRGIASGVDGPMVHYYLGFINEKLGDVAKRDEEYGIGNSLGADYVFPHRPEEEEILRSVGDACDDPQPSYYLGNLLFSLRRFKEGMKAWELAEEKGMRHAVLYRNLGYAYHRICRQGSRALRQYMKAIELDPMDHRLYLEYANICSWWGWKDKGVAALEAARRRMKKDSILARLSAGCLEAGKYDKALEILANNEFTPAEGYYGNWETFVEAHIRRGAKRLAAGGYEGAMQDFSEALQYPANLGVGAPYRPHRHEAMQNYWLGECYLSIGEGKKARAKWREISAQLNFTQQEVLYRGLGLKRSGKGKESRATFRGVLKDATRRERAIVGLRGGMSREYFNFLNYDRELARAYCLKMIAHLGIGDGAEASKEFKKAWRMTKDLGHFKWIYDSWLARRCIGAELRLMKIHSPRQFSLEPRR